MDILHTNRAGPAKEEANTFAVLQQAGRTAVSNSSLAMEILVSSAPACSKTQVKGSMSRFEARLQHLRDAFTVSCPGYICSSDTEM